MIAKKDEKAGDSPLLMFSIQEPYGWRERKTLLTSTNTLSMVTGLLHEAWENTREDEMVEMICYLLEIADGHNNPNNFRGEENKRILTENRMKVSQKAFKILCQKLFKNTAGKSDGPSWCCYVSQKAILEKIFWFFRVNNNHAIQENFWVTNLSSQERHLTEIARTFLVELFDYTWCVFGDSDQTEQLFQDHRKDLIDILYGLGKCRLLLEPPYKSYVDNGCIHHLTSLVLQAEIPHPSDFPARYIRTIEEGCLAGSDAAYIVLALKAIVEEDRKIIK